LDVGSVRTEELEAAIVTVEALNVTTRDIVSLLHSARVLLELRNALLVNDWVAVDRIAAQSAASSSRRGGDASQRDLVAAARLECRRVRAEHILQVRLTELAAAINCDRATGHHWAIDCSAVDTARIDRAIDMLLGTGCERIAVQRLLRIALVLRKMRAAIVEGAVDAVAELHVRMLDDIAAEQAAQEMERLRVGAAGAEDAVKLAATGADAEPTTSSLVSDAAAPPAPPGIGSSPSATPMQSRVSEGAAPQAPPGITSLDTQPPARAAVAAAKESVAEPVSADAWLTWTLPTGEEGTVLGIDVKGAMATGAGEIALLGRHAQFETTLKRLVQAMEVTPDEDAEANNVLAASLMALSDAGCPTEQSRILRDTASHLVFARRILETTPSAPTPEGENVEGQAEWAQLEARLVDVDFFDERLASTVPAKAIVEMRKIQASSMSHLAWHDLVEAMSTGAARRTDGGAKAYRLASDTAKVDALDAAVVRAEKAEAMLRAAHIAEHVEEEPAIMLLPLARTMRFVRFQLHVSTWPVLENVLLRMAGYGGNRGQVEYSHNTPLIDEIDPSLQVLAESEDSRLASLQLLRKPLDASRLPSLLPAPCVVELEMVRVEIVLQRTMGSLRNSLSVGALDFAPGGVDANEVSVAAIDAAVDATRELHESICIDPVHITELRALLLVVVAIRRLRAAVMDRDWFKVSEVLRSIKEVAPLDRLQHPEVEAMKHEVRFQHGLAELDVVSADVAAELLEAEAKYVVSLESIAHVVQQEPTQTSADLLHDLLHKGQTPSASTIVMHSKEEGFWRKRALLSEVRANAASSHVAFARQLDAMLDDLKRGVAAFRQGWSGFIINSDDAASMLEGLQKQMDSLTLKARKHASAAKKLHSDSVGARELDKKLRVVDDALERTGRGAFASKRSGSGSGRVGALFRSDPQSQRPRGYEAPTVGDMLTPSNMERLRAPTRLPLGRVPLARPGSSSSGSTLRASGAPPPFVEPALVDRLGRGKRDAESMGAAIDETRRIKDSMFAAHGVERFRLVRCPLAKANVRLRSLERLRAHEARSGAGGNPEEDADWLVRREEAALKFTYDKITSSLTTLPVRCRCSSSARIVPHTLPPLQCTLTLPLALPLLTGVRLGANRDAMLLAGAADHGRPRAGAAIEHGARCNDAPPSSPRRRAHRAARRDFRADHEAAQRQPAPCVVHPRLDAPRRLLEELPAFRYSRELPRGLCPDPDAGDG
tara:strand:- start:259 stop:3945 length:3687 start_codon:yes stop_codon:yes gene_type:complete